jgi:hypothetical protein
MVLSWLRMTSALLSALKNLDAFPAVSPALQAHYRDYEQMKFSRAVFVIHNMAHQGRGPFVETEQLELPDHYRWAAQCSRALPTLACCIAAAFCAACTVCSMAQHSTCSLSSPHTSSSLRVFCFCT